MQNVAHYSSPSPILGHTEVSSHVTRLYQTSTTDCNTMLGCSASSSLGLAPTRHVLPQLVFFVTYWGLGNLANFNDANNNNDIRDQPMLPRSSNKAIPTPPPSTTVEHLSILPTSVLLNHASSIEAAAQQTGIDNNAGTNVIHQREPLSNTDQDPFGSRESAAAIGSTNGRGGPASGRKDSHEEQLDNEHESMPRLAPSTGSPLPGGDWNQRRQSVHSEATPVLTVSPTLGHVSQRQSTAAFSQRNSNGESNTSSDNLSSAIEPVPTEYIHTSYQNTDIHSSHTYLWINPTPGRSLENSDLPGRQQINNHRQNDVNPQRSDPTLFSSAKPNKGRGDDQTGGSPVDRPHPDGRGSLGNSVSGPMAVTQLLRGSSQHPVVTSSPHESQTQTQTRQLVTPSPSQLVFHPQITTPLAALASSSSLLSVSPSTVPPLSLSSESESLSISQIPSEISPTNALSALSTLSSSPVVQLLSPSHSSLLISTSPTESDEATFPLSVTPTERQLLNVASTTAALQSLLSMSHEASPSTESVKTLPISTTFVAVGDDKEVSATIDGPGQRPSGKSVDIAGVLPISSTPVIREQWTSVAQLQSTLPDNGEILGVTETPLYPAQSLSDEPLQVTPTIRAESVTDSSSSPVFTPLDGNGVPTLYLSSVPYPQIPKKSVFDETQSLTFPFTTASSFVVVKPSATTLDYRGTTTFTGNDWDRTIMHTPGLISPIQTVVERNTAVESPASTATSQIFIISPSPTTMVSDGATSDFIAVNSQHLSPSSIIEKTVASQIPPDYDPSAPPSLTESPLIISTMRPVQGESGFTPRQRIVTQGTPTWTTGQQSTESDATGNSTPPADTLEKAQTATFSSRADGARTGGGGGGGGGTGGTDTPVEPTMSQVTGGGGADGDEGGGDNGGYLTTTPSSSSPLTDVITQRLNTRDRDYNTDKIPEKDDFSSGTTTTTRTAQRPLRTTTPVIAVTPIPTSRQAPSVYVTIKIRMTWNDFCARIDQFKRILEGFIAKSNQYSYELVVDAGGECSSVKNVGKRAAEITVDVYVTDKKGHYNLSMTSEFAQSINRKILDRRPGPFKGKFIKVDVVGLVLATHRLVEQGQRTTSMSTAIIAGIAVGCIVCSVILALILIQMVIIARRRSVKTMRSVSYDNSSRPSVDVQSLEESVQMISVGTMALSRGGVLAYTNPAMDERKDYTSNPVRLTGLREMVSDPEREDFEDEFLMLPNPMPKLCEIPDAVVEKNRYANVIPIQETRVPLAKTQGEHSDYINANFVRGYGSKINLYIATQAPMENTRADFWTMVWQQQSQVILMLTGLEENGHSKCVEYWPNTEGSDVVRIYGDYRVQLVTREVAPFWIRSEILLKNMENNLCRAVEHLWLTSWPSSGVPDDPCVLLKFLEAAEPYMEESHGPPIVHCSPGTGRTGTLLAVDIGRRAWDDSHLVDVLRTVCRLRHDRAGAVQTKDQYAFVYETLLEYAMRTMEPSVSSRASSLFSEAIA